VTDSDSDLNSAPLSAWRRHSAAFWVALQFLTTLPVRSVSNYSKPVLGLSLLYYPLIGLLIGGLLWVLALASTSLLTSLLSAALIVAAWTLLTGALHIDGLADCADAWVGGFGDRERTLELMKDPVSGPVAVATVVVVLLLKTAAVYELLLRFDAAWIVFAPLLGRAAPLVVFLSTPYIRKQGLGEVLAENFSRGPAFTLLILLALGMLLMAPSVNLILLSATLMGLFAMRYLMLQRLGGCTGDTIGATVEIVEVIALLALVIGLPLMQ